MFVSIQMPSTRSVPAIRRRAETGPATWTRFWREFAPVGQVQERCFIPPDARPAVDQHWARFARDLPRGAQVIDIACGAGIIGLQLLAERADLQVSGIDWADVPVSCEPGLTLHPHVSMESLPFPDRSFDAAISLFGIEYGKIADTARELERVLKPGAGFSFLIHHRDSAIVREGSQRRRAVQELLAGRMRNAFLSGNDAGIVQVCQSLATRFPDAPTVKLVADHLRRNIARARAERHAIWQDVDDNLTPEAALLIHLEKSAKSPAELGTWLEPLLTRMEFVSVSVQRSLSGQPIAWLVSGGTR
jgi:SAM-dependent methyltransferase